MLSTKHPPMRNKLDLSDPGQMRIIKKRLGVSDDDLTRLVEKVGDSIAAIEKEAGMQKEIAPPEISPVEPDSTS